MGIKDIDTDDFLAFLKLAGLMPNRTKGSHTSFQYPSASSKSLSRPIVVRTNEKTIPRLHIQSNLKTLGVTVDEFEKWLNGRSKGQQAYVPPSLK